jgi:hypothetical protein
VSKTQVLHGKTAQFNAIAMTRGMPIKPNTETAQKIMKACDVFSIHLRNDKCASNPPANRHVIAVWKAAFGPYVKFVASADCCEIHVGHRIETYDIKSNRIVSVFHSYGKMMQLLSSVEQAATKLFNINAREFDRVVGPPPREAQRLNAILLEQCFDPHADFHGRKKGVNNRITTVLDYFQMNNGSPSTGRKVHYCWDATKSEPCCTSDAEALRKMNKADAAMFCIYASPVVTLSRFTHFDEACSLAITGHAKNKTFPAIMDIKRYDVGYVDSDGKAMEAVDVGAGENDKQKIHNARIERVFNFHAKDEASWDIATLKITHKPVHKVVRAFMGYNKEKIKMQEVVPRDQHRLSSTNRGGGGKERCTYSGAMLGRWEVRSGMVGDSGRWMAGCGRCYLGGVSVGDRKVASGR